MPSLFLTKILIIATCIYTHIFSYVYALDKQDTFLQQQEREKQQRQVNEPNVDVITPTPAIESSGFILGNEQPCFPVDKITLTGADVEKFQSLIESANTTETGINDIAIGQCLGRQDINLVLKRLNNTLLKQGYVTSKAVLPEQSLSDQTLLITVIPGKVSRISFANPDDPRAVMMNALALDEGGILNLRDIEQSLENFKRVPTANVDIKITPSTDKNTERADVGWSDIRIHWQQKPLPFRITSSIDDAGTKATGKFQGNLTVSYDHTFTLNDLMYVSINRDLGGGDAGYRGTRSHTFHYSLPLGYWLLGFTSSNSNYYQSIAGLNGNYVYSGESENQELKLSRVAFRNATQKTNILLAAWIKSYRNYVDDTEVLTQQRRMSGITLGVNHIAYIGDATLSLGVHYHLGTGTWGNLEAPEEAYGTGTATPKFWTQECSLNLPFHAYDQAMNYTFSYRGQQNNTALIPQDKFTIGNRYTVRGYDGETLLSAETGHLIRQDITWQSTPELGFYLGIDHAVLSGPSASLLYANTLTGAAIGFKKSFNKQWFFDTFYGAPVNQPSGFKTAPFTVGFSLIMMI